YDVTVVAELVEERAQGLLFRRLHRRPAGRLRPRRRDQAGQGRPRVGLGQVERERTAVARRAYQVNLAAEQACDLPADRQAQAGASVLAARAAVGLLKGLEDNVLFVGGNADAGIRDREGEDSAGLPKALA